MDQLIYFGFPFIITRTHLKQLTRKACFFNIMFLSTLLNLEKENHQIPVASSQSSHENPSRRLFLLTCFLNKQKSRRSSVQSSQHSSFRRFPATSQRFFTPVWYFSFIFSNKQNHGYFKIIGKLCGQLLFIVYTLSLVCIGFLHKKKNVIFNLIPYKMYFTCCSCFFMIWNI